MSRDPRYLDFRRLVEVTVVVTQNRFLLRPSEETNDLFVGVVGYAQRKLDMEIISLTALSTHWHGLFRPRDAEHLAQFMQMVDCNLSKEIGTRLHGWPGGMWDTRYKMVPVTDEEAAQVDRLRYQLANGVKEGLVDKAEEWPGVHSAKALMTGAPLVGHWYNRSREYAARQLRREKNVEASQFATEERIVFSPLPCWEELSESERQQRVTDLVASIDEEARQERERTGKKSLGVKKILRVNPTKRKAVVEKSPRPRVHAKSREKRREWLEALQEIVIAHREASERLRDGDRNAEFPEGTFPCALPFVPLPETLMLRSRGQPA